jgi:hypothetical protein
MKFNFFQATAVQVVERSDFWAYEWFAWSGVFG